MAGADIVDYEKKREGIRASLKWYITTLTALGAALGGSVSLAVLPDLIGTSYLWYGIGLGFAALAFVLLGLWHAQSLLHPVGFTMDQLKDPKIARLMAAHDKQICPIEVNSSAEVVQALEAELTNPDRTLASIEPLRNATRKLTDIGAYLDLNNRMHFAHGLYIAIFLATLGMIAGLISVQHLAKKEKAASDVQAVQFSPSTNWADYQSAIAAACPVVDGTPLAATGKADTPFDGWWTITLSGPNCKGVVLSVPAATVTASE